MGIGPFRILMPPIDRFVFIDGYGSSLVKNELVGWIFSGVISV